MSTHFLTSCIRVVTDPIFLGGLICGVSLFVVPNLVVYEYKRRTKKLCSHPSGKKGSENEDLTDEDEEWESEESSDEENSDLEDHVPSGEEVKMILLVRNDLGMGKGKAAAQVAHAAVQAYKQASANAKNLLQVWTRHGQPKVVLKVNNEPELLKLAEEARKKRLVTCVISDAGRTQIPTGSRTCAAIGPALRSEVDRLTGHLKLY